MTDIIQLAKILFRRIEWQSVPYDVTLEDLTLFIAEAIKHLYVMTGRAAEFSESMLVVENDVYINFANELR